MNKDNVIVDARRLFKRKRGNPAESLGVRTTKVGRVKNASVTHITQRLRAFSWSELTHYFEPAEMDVIIGWIDRFTVEIEPCITVTRKRPALRAKIARYFGASADTTHISLYDDVCALMMYALHDIYHYGDVRFEDLWDEDE